MKFSTLLVMTTFLFTAHPSLAKAAKNDSNAKHAKHAKATTAPAVVVTEEPQEIKDVIKEYSDRTGQSFVLDTQIRGKIILINKDKQTDQEFFNQLAASLMLNGFTWVKSGKDILVIPAREAMRMGGELIENIKDVQPLRMVSLIFKPKKLKVEEINKTLRALTTKYGEMMVAPDGKSVIIIDFTDNLKRIEEILKKLDSN